MNGDASCGHRLGLWLRARTCLAIAVHLDLETLRMENREPDSDKSFNRNLPFGVVADATIPKITFEINLANECHMSFPESTLRRICPLIDSLKTGATPHLTVSGKCTSARYWSFDRKARLFGQNGRCEEGTFQSGGLPSDLPRDICTGQKNFTVPCSYRCVMITDCEGELLPCPVTSCENIFLHATWSLSECSVGRSCPFPSD